MSRPVSMARAGLSHSDRSYSTSLPASRSTGTSLSSPCRRSMAASSASAVSSCRSCTTRSVPIQLWPMPASAIASATSAWTSMGHALRS